MITTNNMDADGRYVIRDYADSPPFASFLPGIAGPMGRPLWSFYVNRGQCITSLGVEGKDKPILEFEPANRAYQSVSLRGFRTFIKIDREGEAFAFHEPFIRTAPNLGLDVEMRIGLNDLLIRDLDETVGIETRVLYFVLPSEPFPALVRRVIMKNVSSETLTGEMLDGVPVVIPYGVSNDIMKAMSNTAMAWMRVESLDDSVAFYRVSASLRDGTEVTEYSGGNFYRCQVEAEGEVRPLEPIVDPNLVFGQNASLMYPDAFLNESLKGIAARPQVRVGRLPCAFAGTAFKLAPGGEMTLTTLLGQVESPAILTRRAEAMRSSDYVQKKHDEARALASDLSDVVATQTSEPTFDWYCRQSFFDNVLRGGFPLVFANERETHVHYIYSRKHGDLERDYNAFLVPAEYYSQGNGNYRDINQNRRCDVLIEPRIGDHTIRTFLNLIQADGYNPLEIRPSCYVLESDALDEAAAMIEGLDDARALLQTPFTPGRLLQTIENAGAKLTVNPEAFIAFVLSHASEVQNARHVEGYWVDHWTYCLDLIDTYLAVYPDRRDALFFDRRDYTFFDNAALVLPRSAKYVAAGDSVRRRGSVRIDPEKEGLIRNRRELPNTMRSQGGLGPIYRTDLFNKLLCLCAVKFSTLDPCGMGVEMEADKPGWYDPLNGLPALFGSSLSETYEIKRLIAVLIDAAAVHPDRTLDVACEVWDLLRGLRDAVEADAERQDDFAYWDRTTSLRENYRQITRLGFSGEERHLKLGDVTRLLVRLLDKIEVGLEKARQLNAGVPPTYFSYTPTRFSPQRDGAGNVLRAPDGAELVRVEGFEQHALPLFLEATVKEMKQQPSTEDARRLYARVKDSELFDDKLRMYRANAWLREESMHIGRARAFTRGWLENESVFLHMHYKYCLAMLKAGLFSEFWAEAKRMLIPFLDPDVYGRSILENSSFIVSSVHPDPTLHGRGFVARLSGAAAEFVNMWALMMFGPQPFRMEDGELLLEFWPSLPCWFFKQDGTLTFTFLGCTQVTYHNPSGRDTFGDDAARPTKIRLTAIDGRTTEIAGDRIAEPWASATRERKVARIEVFLGDE